MEKLTVWGGYPLDGTVHIHGAKNGALPLLAATVLCQEPVILENCPKLADVSASISILRRIGCCVEEKDDGLRVDASCVNCCTIPQKLMSGMRSSIVFLGAILARCGKARMTYPGGCELGPRPIDLHLSSLKKLGAVVEERHGFIFCSAPRGLHGTEITLPFPSVGATENILLGACTAEGTTLLRHPACEPEIQDLCRFLNSCGAKITVADDGALLIEGVPALHGCRHAVLPDRIECATFLAAAAVTGGRVTLTHCCPSHLAPILPPLEESGCRFTVEETAVHMESPAKLQSLGEIRTMPHPGFPTDAGAPLLAMACVAQGTTVFSEGIFENRFRYVDELVRMGASVRVNGRMAVVTGTPKGLQGAEVNCTDLRGGAALVIAGLTAKGKTRIGQLEHLDRGYDSFASCLQSLGAHIERK